MRRLINWWSDLSIRLKFLFIVSVMLVAAWSLVFLVMYRFRQSNNVSNRIMHDYLEITDFMDSFSAENVALETYIRPYAENGRQLYTDAIARTDSYLPQLTPHIASDPRSEYVLKRAVCNAMSYFRVSQQLLLDLKDHDEIINQYLYLKKQAAYIDSYARDLLHIRTVQGAEKWQQIAEVNQRSARQFVMILVVSTLMVLLSLLLFIRSILRPIAELGRAADRISARQYDAPPLTVQGHDELGRTARSFNLMQEDIRVTIQALEKQSKIEKNLLEREVEAEQMQRRLQEGRFALLQSQINPHFLFNILSTIAALAREEGAMLTEDLILRLSRFFRYSLESEDRIVPLSREIQLLRDYMKLQESRYGSRICFEVFSDPELEQLLVPKFILQPLVENAILHGLKERKSGGIIRVRTWLRKGVPTITCTDNGKGYDTHAPLPDGPRRSIGLDNISERMELSGGKLEMFSILGIGTQARITFAEPSSEKTVPGKEEGK